MNGGKKEEMTIMLIMRITATKQGWNRTGQMDEPPHQSRPDAIVERLR